MNQRKPSVFVGKSVYFHVMGRELYGQKGRPKGRRKRASDRAKKTLGGVITGPMPCSGYILWVLKLFHTIPLVK